MKRRNFISLIGTTLLASPVLGQIYHSTETTVAAGDASFPQLPYPYDALEPVIDAQTMELHYDKHHRGYFTKFIAAIKDTPAAKNDFKTLFDKTSTLSSAIRNNGGGFYNHCLFWENLSPKETTPSPALLKAIERDFGSFDKFKENFANAAKKHFGSGWAWLSVGENGRLFISTTPNQDNPLMDVVTERGTPILALDVWEHAYYLHYQNRRAEYVDNILGIINWDQVSARYAAV